MTASQQHIVARYAVELDFQEREAAGVVADEVMAVCRQQAAAVIQEYCDSLVAEDVYVSIGRLSLDLGELDPRLPARDFIRKFREALALNLEIAVEQAGANAPEERALELVAHYGKTGQYPWWTGAPSPQRLFGAVAILLRAADPALYHRLRDILADATTLRRLVLGLPLPQIVAVWEAMMEIQPPGHGQALRRHAMLAIMAAATALPRSQWQEAAFKGCLSCLPHSQVAAHPEALLAAVQAETGKAFSSRLLERFARREGFALSLCWLWEVMDMPISLCADLMEGWGNASGQVPGLPPRVTAALAQWLRETWHWDVETSTRLLAHLGQHGRHAANEESEAMLEAYAQLRQHLGLATDSPSQVLQALLLRFSQEGKEPSPTVISAWLRDSFALSPSKAAALGQAMAARAAALEMGGLGRPQHVPVSSEAGSPDAPAYSAELLALLPWLRKRLDLPEANPAELLATLLAGYQAQAAVSEVEATAIAEWLRASFPMTPQARTALAQAMEDAATAMVHGISQDHRTATPPHPPVAPEPAPGLPPLDGQPLSHTQTHPSNLETEHAEIPRHSLLEAPEWTTLLAWLRQRLDLMGASAPAVLETLLSRYFTEEPDGKAEEETLMAWLRATFPMTVEARTVLARAMEAQAAIHHSSPRIILDTPQAEPTPYRDGEKQYPAGEVKPVPMEGMDAGTVEQEHPLPLLQHGEAISPLPGSDGPDADPSLRSEGGAAMPPPRSHSLRWRREPYPEDLPLWVYNAGLVLFWPFLQRYFQYQGLVEDQRFRSPLAQEQAVCLLQQMVAPPGDWNESELSLPKLLCGLPTDAIVDTAATPPPTEDVDAVLIEAVLAHWTLAGQLSPAAFRQAWLCRKGTLRIREDHWLLRVERLAHDVLLEGLPWDIAYISLPWMPHVLYVDWKESPNFPL